MRQRTGAATNVEPTRIRSQRQPFDELACDPPAPSSHKRFVGVTRRPHVVLRGASRRYVLSSQAVASIHVTGSIRPPWGFTTNVRFWGVKQTCPNVRYFPESGHPRPTRQTLEVL